VVSRALRAPLECLTPSGKEGLPVLLGRSLQEGSRTAHQNEKLKIIKILYRLKIHNWHI